MRMIAKSMYETNGSSSGGSIRNSSISGGNSSGSSG